MTREGPRLSIDHGRCQGHARCAVLAPELFTTDEDGNGQVISDAPVPEHLVHKAYLAASNCPEMAITVAEGEA